MTTRTGAAHDSPPLDLNLPGVRPWCTSHVPARAHPRGHYLQRAAAARAALLDKVGSAGSRERVRVAAQ